MRTFGGGEYDLDVSALAAGERHSARPRQGEDFELTVGGVASGVLSEAGVCLEDEPLASLGCIDELER